MLGGGSFTLFHVRGIRISVDWSWFLIFFFLIFSMSRAYGIALDEDATAAAPFALAVASAVLFFGSILFHELGHAWAALRHRIGITGIQLWIFGGVANLDRESDSPRAEFDVAIAGPVATLLVIFGCCVAGSALSGPGDFMHAVRLALELQADRGVSGLASMFAWLAAINAFVLVFNLLPAFPMDGGRVARALIWWRTGNRTRATRIAATMGRGFGYLFMGIGLVLVATGDLIGGIWIGFVGVIVNGAARGAMMQTALTSRIGDIRVADVMDREPVTIPGDISVERALDEYFLRYRWPWFPVVDAAHRFLGLIQRDRADEVPEISRASSHVAELVDDDTTLFVRDDTPLDALLSNQNLRKLGALMAVDADGRLSGVVTVEQVGRALRDS